MPALLILLAACEGPARFPSPQQAGLGVAESWVWATDPVVGYELALPGFPTVTRAEDGEIAQLAVLQGAASFSVSSSAPLPEADRARAEALVSRAAESRLESLGVKGAAVAPWLGLEEGKTFSFPEGELRAGLLDDRLVVLVARGGGSADAAFLDSFSAEPMAPTRVGLPGTGRRVRCPARCGAAVYTVLVGGQPMETTGLAGMVGLDRFRAVGARGEGAREAVLGALVGQATLVEEGELSLYRTGTDTVLVRVVEVRDEVAAAAVLATVPPPWAEGFLRSLE